MINKKEHFKDKRLKVTYRTLPNELSGDEGEFFDCDDIFLILKLNDKTCKWIPINNIIRIQQI